MYWPVTIKWSICCFGNILVTDTFHGVKINFSPWRVLPIMAYTGEATPQRETYFRLQVYERVGNLPVEVYERVGESVIWVCERAHRANR